MIASHPGLPAGPDPSPIRRRYVVVAGQHIHLRLCGNGPPVVLLHDSPRSSRLHGPTLQALAAQYTVIAPDTPGYGNSDPLPHDAPVIADFAARLDQTLVALGLERAPLYATHTSAKIALAWVDRGGRPARLVLDGLSMPEQLATDGFIASYMRPFTPDPAGAYLAAEWSRTRDMLRWFPWFSATPGQRIAMEPPAPAWLADYGIDLFSAGRHYADAYAAAMRFDPGPALARSPVPTVVAARTDDVLHGYLPRAAACGNPLVTTQSLPADRSAWLDWLRAALSGGPADWAPDDRTPPPARSARDYLELAHGQLHVARFGTDGPRPWLVLSAPTTMQARAWAAALADHGPVYVPDLPGFGESDALPGPGADPLALADHLGEAIDQLGPGRINLLGIGLAAPLAALLARQRPDRVAALAIDGAPPLDPAAAAAFADGLCPPLPFDAHAGSHLHRIWHILRDGEVQWPWHDQRLTAARRLPALLDADELHAALTGVLKHSDHWGQSALAALATGPAAWGPLPVPLLIFAHADPAYAEAERLAGLCATATTPRPDALAEAAGVLAQFVSTIREPA